MKEIEAATVDMILADLPYGTTQNKWDSVLPLDQLWAAWKRVCKPGAPIVLFTQQPFTTTVAASNLKQLRTEWIWVKPSGTGHLNAKIYPMKAHENVLVFCDRTPPYHPQKELGHRPYKNKSRDKTSSNYGAQRPVEAINLDGSRYPKTLLHFPPERGHHPTQKPVPLLEYLICTYTDPGMTVLDCTMGSGSTGVAAIQTGRSFIGLEMDEEYFNIARERISNSLAGERTQCSSQAA